MFLHDQLFIKPFTIINNLCLFPVRRKFTNVSARASSISRGARARASHHCDGAASKKTAAIELQAVCERISPIRGQINRSAGIKGDLCASRRARARPALMLLCSLDCSDHREEITRDTRRRQQTSETDERDSPVREKSAKKSDRATGFPD